MDSSSFFLTTIVAATIGFFTILFTIFKILRLHQEEDEETSSPPSSLSPSSPPSSLNRIWTHHVFPSFRGEDVRRDFLSHIQMEFQRMGITTFIDNEIKRGESIGPELIQAIRGSKIAIILLSRNYASSSWCLDELVEIMKCKEELGQMVMAVFYKVDPSDVKKLTGDFGKIFRKTCAGKTKQVIGRWRQALAKVATIAGYHSSNWDNEAAMIKQISTDISNELNNSALSSDFDGLVGMRAHLKKMGPLLCLDSDEVRMIGIWGPSGIGKTTIARVAYSKFSNNFQLNVFMESLEVNYTRPCSDDYSAKLHLQQQFMSQITNQNDMKISHLGVVKDRLKDKKVLVVLDGVDQSMQLDAMAKETWWFVTNLVGNLPLGLRVMGSYFRGLSKQEWKKELPRLRTSLDADIQSILKFSYDALDDEEKYLFLHIACFFNHQVIEKVVAHLSYLFFDVRQGSREICEILTDDVGPLPNLKWMDLSSSQNLKELPDLSTATNLLELDLRDCSSLVKLPSTIGYTKNLQKLNLCGCSSLISLPSFIGTSTNLQILNLRGCSSLVELPSFYGNFINLSELNLSGLLNLSRLSSLVELPSFVGNFINLRTLSLSRLLNLVELPSFVGNATNLEMLDLSYCSSLVELPFSIGNLQKLQTLSLYGCSKLEFLPTDINLESLDILELTNCLLFKFFPDISTNLRTLNLRGTAIEEVPSSIESWSRLNDLRMTYSVKLKECPHAFDVITELDVDDKGIQELPPWINRFSRLKSLKLIRCKKLVSLPQIPDATHNIVAEDCESLETLDCSFQNPNISLNFAKCFKLNQEARDLIIRTRTSEYAVLPGGEVPSYFTHRATTGDSLTVKLNEKPLPTSMRFKACILLVNESDDETCFHVYVTCQKTNKLLYGLFKEHLYIFEVEMDVTTSELIFEFKVRQDDWAIGQCNWKIGQCGVIQLL
ncbi:probable disease resistance protein RPP1 isoform X6 [Capsella rubella]|uniref:probable disease resistance protein RPP1 isoform X6 n=1 Tax=Capsella rubella TaxID=81985 RepID=UPI000CD523DA|nr:probable disease resistance protein RPP1 isoform X6 [Capsella rubella]